MRRNISKGNGNLYFSDVYNAKHLSVGYFPPRLKFNGFAEFYFKTTKSDLLYHFKKFYKSSNYVGNENNLLSWLNDFNDRATINDDGDLMFD